MSGYLLLVAVALVVIAGLAAGHMTRRHGGRVLVWRWLSGHALDGAHRTDAGWLQPASRVLHPSGRAARWHHRPRALRAGVRTGATASALAACWGLITHRAATLAGLEALAAAAAAAGAWAAWRATRAWRHRRAWVRPLHLALGRALGVPLAWRPESWLDVPQGFATREGAQITVNLPDHFSGGADARRGIAEVVAAKLALEDPRANWHLSGRQPHVTFTVQVPPPSKVSLGDVRELIAAATPTAPLIGLGRAGRPVYVDLDGDSPHVLISAGSGGGKSVTMRALVAQLLARGAVCLVLDVKRLSHAWARGLPNVAYCRDIGEIHEALLWLRGELDRRNEIADAGADMDGETDHVDIGPRLLVLAEEMNALSARLAAYWRKIRDKDDPAQSPAVEALGDALFMGRQVRVNVLAVAQMFTARTAGGPEARENMGVRVLARHTMNNARMLVPEIYPFPKASRHRGRVQVCVAGEARETQVLFLTPAEARAMATSGAVSLFPSIAAGAVPVSSPPRLQPVSDAAPVGLRQAVAEGLVPIGLEAIRKARQQDSEFPAPVAQAQAGEFLYDPAALKRWAANRPRAMAASGE